MERNLRNKISNKDCAPLGYGILSRNEIDENQNQNPNENRGIIRPKKVILKKNVRQLKVPNKNSQINNNPLQKKDLGILSDDNLDHPKPLTSDYYDEGKDDVKKILAQKNVEKHNIFIKKEEIKPKGYLDDDLDDEDNKKIYLRVIKRLEKTLGIPVIGAKIPGEPINDIEIEENIRPIIFNGNLNKENDYEIIKDKEINYKSESPNTNQNSINNQLNNKNINNNRYNKNNDEKTPQNNYLNNIENNDKKKENETKQKTNKPMINTKNGIQNINNNSKREYNNNMNENKNMNLNNSSRRENINNTNENKNMNLNNSSRRENINNTNENKNMNLSNSSRRENINNINENKNMNLNNSSRRENINNINENKNMNLSNSSRREIINNINENKNMNLNNINKNQVNQAINKINNQNINYKNNNYNYEQGKKNLSGSNEKMPNNEIHINSYTKMNQNKNASYTKRKISYENSYQNSNKNQNYPKNLIKANNNNNQQYIKVYISNKNENQPIQKNPINAKNQKYTTVSKSLPFNQFNNMVIPDMQRGKEIFIKENESEVNSAKVKTQTYERGGKFNNVQTTYVVYSKRENQPGYVKTNKSIIDNYHNLRNKRLNINSSDLFTKTPVKRNYVDNSLLTINQNNSTCNKYSNANEQLNKYYEMNSPQTGIQNNSTRINAYKTIDNNPMNRSQNTLSFNQHYDYYKEINNRNSFDGRYKNTEYSEINNRNNYNNKYRNNEYNLMKRNQAINNYYNENKKDKLGVNSYQNYYNGSYEENKPLYNTYLGQSNNLEYYNY